MGGEDAGTLTEARYCSGLSSRAFATPKIALVAPMPIVRERGAATVKPAALMRVRMLFMSDQVNGVAGELPAVAECVQALAGGTFVGQR